jgi:hypothetical protein
VSRTPAALLVALAAAGLASGGCGDPSFDRRAGQGGRGVGEACTRASDCRSNLCLSRVCATSIPAGACGPSGHRPTVALGAVTGPADRPPDVADPPCALPVSAAVIAPVQERGTHAPGDEVSFDVPAGTTGFTLYLQEVDGTAPEAVDWPGAGPSANAPFPQLVLDPGGAHFYDDAALAPTVNGTRDYSQWLLFYAGVIPSAGAITVPNTSTALDRIRSDGQLAPGAWRFTLNDLAAACTTTAGCAGGSTEGRYDVKVVTRAGPLVSTGTLDLEIYLVSNDPAHPEYTAANAAADPSTNATAAQFRRFVDGLQSLFARAGVCLGTVTFHDVADWARAELNTPTIDDSGPCSELSRLFRLAEPRNAVHLFLVDELTTSASGTGGTVVGLDGSIPGPSGVPGGVNSGAAVVLADLGAEAAPGACSPASPFSVAACGTDLVSYIAAHEAGHWLGLYHTTEATGTALDPLADTPGCPCGTCRSSTSPLPCGTALLSAPQCAGTSGCGGGDNLMFWQIDPSISRGTLTPQQGEVVRLNPAVR